MKKIIFSIQIISLLLLLNRVCNGQSITVNPNDTVNLELPVFTGTVQWQESVDSLTWSDISGANYQPYQIIALSSKFYRARINNGMCNPVYSGSRHVIVTAFVCGTSTLADIDGNAYNTVSIGAQCWMRENLKTAKYRDGTVIPNVIDNATWAALTTGARSYYNNDSTTNTPVYGVLYNWYAATDVHNLCPTGWHLPTHDEWTTLERAICTSGTCVTDFPYDITTTGYRGTDEGGKMKETGTIHWTSPNTGATNSSGFGALPGGDRGLNGPYYGIGFYGSWWSATAYDAASAWKRYLNYGNSQVYRVYDNKTYGLSIRCVRD